MRRRTRRHRLEPMDNGAAVTVRDLRKSYADVAAVRGIDLEINRGEVFALLGPDGAGKTTTVEIMEGSRCRDHGTVDVLGEDPARAGRAWRARIGIVLQLASAGPELTVLEIVRHFAAFYPGRSEERRVGKEWRSRSWLDHENNRG